jgi:hypothetical protein
MSMDQVATRPDNQQMNLPRPRAHQQEVPRLGGSNSFHKPGQQRAAELRAEIPLPHRVSGHPRHSPARLPQRRRYQPYAIEPRRRIAPAEPERRSHEGFRRRRESLGCAAHRPVG